MAKVTLKDIAREVGLSPTAVSLVLNDRPCKISAESRARIKEVARKKRYIPNQIARSLVTQHSQTLGLLKLLYAEDLRVPRDYSVVSYDNSAADTLFEPALTSIEQNSRELAAAALELMFARLEEDAESRERAASVTKILRPRVVVKDSVRWL